MRSRRNRELNSWWNDPQADRETKKQVNRNNLLAIVIMVIILVFGLNIGGCTDKIGHLLG